MDFEGEKLRDEIRKEIKPPIHYHGEGIRQLFLSAAVLMLVFLPIFHKNSSIPLFFSILAIVILVFAAGLTTPKRLWTIWLDTFVATLFFIVFGYYAFVFYKDANGNLILIIVNHLLSVLFLIALYFSARTLRWFILQDSK